MKRFIFAAIAAVAAGSASAAVLWNNGPFITGVGNGFNGADTSEIETGFNSFGYAANATFHVADDFTVGANPWDLDDMRGFSYQTGSTTTSTFTGAFVQIYNGAPNAGGVVIAGDTTTNRLTTGAFSNVYRVTSTTLTNNQRPIMQLTIDMSWAPLLNPGTYWMEFYYTGTLASGPWCPPVTPNPAGANALQLNAGTWAPMAGAGFPVQDTTFILNGTEVPEPGTFLALGVGLAAITALRRRK
jgi:hypothetical protein